MAAGQLEGGESGRDWEQIRENLREEIESYNEKSYSQTLRITSLHKEKTLYKLFSYRLEGKSTTPEVKNMGEEPLGYVFNFLQDIGFIEPRVDRNQVSEQRYDTESYTARDIVKMDRMLEEELD